MVTKIKIFLEIRLFTLILLLLTLRPDFGVPCSPISFLQFLKQVRDSKVLDEDTGPAIIHCSAGIGRSGTFILVDCCLVMVFKNLT